MKVILTMFEFFTDLFSNFWFLFFFIVINGLILWYYLGLLSNVLSAPADGKAKYVMITGCDSGFGLRTALDLNVSRCTVLAGCLTDEGVKRLSANPTFKGTAFKMDVTKQEDIEEAAKLVDEKTKDDGGLYALVNNAGIIVPAPIEWQSTEMMKRVMEVNLWGTVNVTKAMLPFLKQKRGRIVNVSSMAGRVLLGYSTSYCCSKYAVEAFSDGLRFEMKPWGLKVSIIEPGMFATDILKQSTIRGTLTKAWNEQTEQRKVEYGERYLNELMKLYDDITEKFASPEVYKVVSAINHAVLSSNPKPRYHVGLDAKTLWMTIAVLPTKIGDWIGSSIAPAIVPDVVQYKNNIINHKKRD